MMQQTYNAVIADASCLIILEKIDSFVLLQKLFGAICTSPEVAREFGSPLPEWITVKDVKDKNFQRALQLDIDLGEASAIALAAELQPALLIIDDLKGRRLAERLHLNYTGTLGLILKAKTDGILPTIKPLLDNIQLTNFRLSSSLLQNILHKAGEE